MSEQIEKQNNADELKQKLKGTIDEVLATGDWNDSLFLKNVASKLKGLKERIDGLSSGDTLDGVDDRGDKQGAKLPPPGYIQVCILLYQVDSENLQNWFGTIKTLIEHSVTRPAYRDEAEVKEVIRSKESSIGSNGYAIVNIKEDSINQGEELADASGNPLLSLKEDAVKLENIMEFVHANKKRYALSEKGLVFLGEIQS